jgi:hypothetical protein
VIIVGKLTPSEIHLAWQVAIMRSLKRLQKGIGHMWGCEQKPQYANDFNGALGEMMLAKHLDRFWAGAFGGPDVGQCYQVRATDHPLGKLICHPEDADDQPFVLARILLPEVHLVGWLWGHEAKFPGYWCTDYGRPAFFAWPVQDMETLPTEAEVLQHQHETAA